ncbi:NEK/NEK1 protein kinase [Saprolegnia parasitica CBS 223.65]|uniref:non-specific serine/threonine protein kinase n=1 Tax=Saprolegnia parasitica (strain CBS 223.65) TaxID=695850 RepID=A0A067CUI0_SAPPC|nr:NEK/NEK1 protein kinase [Saprolegnia parasitica CBS 223.65]KDO34359.1 NEK/NEK1 protein kinase [Saprolegnia parasitica CBS 223.65]|eukprot:XP_012195095.1 NEK/NEK1 protein kinase [Saprolegnia parasitica CBS 223.65]
MDKYRKLERIGKGSFGAAYLAEKKGDATGTKYVIKEIPIDPRDSTAAIREARLLGALDHPNIIASKESFVLPGRKVMCIVTEYADGGDLRQRLKRCMDAGRRLPEEAILDLFVQICLALKHVHDRKILHRDIKPENIFLMASNVVKLGDFGVAKVLSNTLACADTQTGTPYYTSPEICVGKRYNHKTDVWSLGCVLYELVTLSHAFNGPNQRQLFLNIANGAYDTQRLSSVSSRLAALVQDMLRKNPRERPSINAILKTPLIRDRIQTFLSAQEMQDELGHTVLHGQHIFQPRRGGPASSKAPVPSSPRAMKQPPPPPIPQAHVRPLLQRHEVMAQKKERVQKQRADAALRNAEAKVALERKARLLAAKKLHEKKNSPPKKGPQDLGRRVAAFNAQWERQKLDLVANLPPKSAPTKAAVDFKQKIEAKRAELLAAQAARDACDVRALDDSSVGLGPKYKYPPSDRDLSRLKMCEDIRERKKQLQRGDIKHALEDPVILVQALKPPPPDVEVMTAPDTLHYGSTVGVISPRKPALRIDADAANEDIRGLAFHVQELRSPEVHTARDGRQDIVQRHNQLEYERMLLQMKSVMDAASSPTANDDDDDDDDDNDDDNDDAISTPDGAPMVLPQATLEDPAFVQQLQALLKDASAVPSGPTAPLLTWARDYVQHVLST